MIRARYADVAVPLPLVEALTYALPPHLAAAVQPGCRVRVPVGRRRCVGVVTALRDAPPEGVEAKELLELLDADPVLPPDLLELGRFAAEYYLASPGEALRGMVPAGLPPLGERRIWLTDRGALAPARSAAERRLVALLLERGRVRVAELQGEVGIAELWPLLDTMVQQGRIAVDEAERRGTRYVKAVELRPGDRQAQLAACGRSAQGRSVVEYLDALGRPATLGEVVAVVGCGTGVVRRLVSLGLLREFTQPERLSLARHRLAPKEHRPVTLRHDQSEAVGALRRSLGGGAFRGFLLTGMTGSGKTEVYLQAADEALRQGRSVILLVPEIALVPALAETARARFGRRMAILHSNLSGAERQQEWERLRRGEAQLVLGPRSALFAPVDNLGLVVVDEEHDAAYKQDAAPRYNGRDLALFRARQHRATAVLVSATPSLESRWNAERGKLAPLHLTRRAGGGTLPEGILVDLRQEAASRRPGEVHISSRLRAELEECLAAGSQAILLRNRRGYAPVLLCRACGEDFRCDDCGLPRTYHRRDGRLVCHYCGRQRGTPKRCPACGEQALEPIGAGTERVEERFRELFPEVAVEVLDADAARRVGGAAAVLERFAAGRSQVLIGTQMVSKGHHFPRVALAAVLAADTYLNFPDFRAVERTYALLTQLAGRAGRGTRPGKVVIQTFHPDHYAVQAALRHDDAAFAAEEMRFRRIFHYPPFTRMIQLLVRHRDRQSAETALVALAERLWADPAAEGVRISGPAPAPLERLRGRWRFQLLLRGPSGRQLRQLVSRALAGRRGPELTVDVDPYDVM